MHQVYMNELDKEVKSIKSSDTFGQKISSTTKIPSWFTRGDRITNTWHARMRMKCSLLNDDLYSHIHVIDSPECSCGFRRETSKHFLLECPLYTGARDVMLSDLALIGFKPTVSNLLFGMRKALNRHQQ